MKRKKILVTGANGFIGKCLVPELRRNGFGVTVLTRKEADLTKSFPQARVKGANAIVHLASSIDINHSLTDPRERLDTNSAMVLNLLEAVRNSGKKPLIIFISTDRVYGKTKRRIVTEGEPPFPLEPYTASKMVCEVMLETYSYLYDIPYVILRLDSVYGPGQPRVMFISDVIQKMRAADRIETGPLQTRKNFVYVSDVAGAIVAALRAPAKAYNKIYNIGGRNSSLRDVLQILKRIFAHREKRSILVHEKSIYTRPSKIEVAPFKLSIAKARRELHWYPKTSLYKGLTKTVEYFLSL